MALFVLELGNGPGFDPARGRREQLLWDEHAAYMDRLVDEGVVVLGGPVGDGGTVLLVLEAAGEAEVRARLDDDPWAPLRILTVQRLEPWTVWLDGRARG